MLGGDGRRAEARVPASRAATARRSTARSSGCAAVSRPTRSSCTRRPTRPARTSSPAANALGLFAGDGRLIVVDGVEAWKADDAKAIAAYLKAPAPGDHARARRRRAEEGRAAREGGRAHGRGADLGGRARRPSRRWVAEQFKLHGAKAEPEACRALIVLVGDDLYELATEIDKLATWAAGEPITADDRRGARRAARRRQQLRAHRRLRARATSPACSSPPSSCSSAPRDPRSRTIPRVASILTSHVARLRQCQALEAEGLSAKDAAARLKQHPFYVQKLFAQARNFTPGRAARGDGPPRRARPRAQGRLAPDGRARARARADRDRPAARSRVRAAADAPAHRDTPGRRSDTRFVLRRHRRRNPRGPRERPSTVRSPSRADCRRRTDASGYPRAMHAVALVDPKYPHNVGVALRACAVFGVRTASSGAAPGRPIRTALGTGGPREERMKAADVEFGSADGTDAIPHADSDNAVRQVRADDARQLASRERVYGWSEDGRRPEHRSRAHAILRTDRVRARAERSSEPRAASSRSDRPSVVASECTGSGRRHELRSPCARRPPGRRASVIDATRDVARTRIAQARPPSGIGRRHLRRSRLSRSSATTRRRRDLAPVTRYAATARTATSGSVRQPCSREDAAEASACPLDGTRLALRDRQLAPADARAARRPATRRSRRAGPPATSCARRCSGAARRGRPRGRSA